jgi:hypothetical protein
MRQRFILERFRSDRICRLAPRDTAHFWGGAHVKTDLQLPTRKHVVSLFPFAISRSRAGGNPVECAR